MKGNQDEPVVRMLAGLPSLTPSADRAERTRSRCHAVLAQDRRRQSLGRLSAARFVDVMLFGALAVYLAGAVSEAVWLGSFF